MSGTLRWHRSDEGDHDEPLDTWTVRRTWQRVSAGSGAEAAELVTGQLPSALVTAVRDDLSPRLYDTVLSTVVLCRYTGARQDADQCEFRAQRRHPDQDCWQAYDARAD